MARQTISQVAENTAQKALFPVAIITGLLAFVFNFGYWSLPIFNNLHSIAVPVIALSFVVCWIGFFYGYREGLKLRLPKPEFKKRNRQVLFFGGNLGLLFSLLVGAFTVIMSVLFNNAFVGLKLDFIISSIIAGAYCSAIAYFILVLSYRLSPEDIINGLGVFLVGGVTLSMLTVNDPLWWEQNFSFLGVIGSGAALVFNTTLVLSGIALFIVVEYLFEGKRKAILATKKISEKRYGITKWLFVYMSLAFIGIGFFPWKEDTFFATMHNFSVNTLAVCLFITLVGIQWLLPVFNRSFYINSYIIGGMFAVLGLLWTFTSYMNQTAFELSSFLIAGAWILLFMRSMSEVGKETETA